MSDSLQQNSRQGPSPTETTGAIQTRLPYSSRSQSLTLFHRLPCGRRSGGLTSLPHRLIHHNGASDRHIQRRDLPRHRNPQQMVARPLHQIVQARAFPSQHEDTISPEVIVGVVRCSALVESKHPDMLLLHLFERGKCVQVWQLIDNVRFLAAIGAMPKLDRPNADAPSVAAE